METFLGLYLVFALLALIVLILWILLPFAVFGIKPLLIQIRDDQRALLDAVREGNQQRVPGVRRTEGQT
jgi:hypothetical protein